MWGWSQTRARLQNDNEVAAREIETSCSLKLSDRPNQMPRIETPAVTSDRTAVASGATDHNTEAMLHARYAPRNASGQRARAEIVEAQRSPGQKDADVGDDSHGDQVRPTFPSERHGVSM